MLDNMSENLHGSGADNMLVSVKVILEKVEKLLVADSLFAQVFRNSKALQNKLKYLAMKAWEFLLSKQKL